ncbi:hypothetical protein C8J57DRAFT_1320979 [Mycena rebaudengoi]|nr:hypothetical protein C8J57DRAFT_1320979 [Mycena rebaudengoi]
MAPSTNHRLDAILPMMNDYMQNIVLKEKNYEFRRYLISPSVQRIWFYLNAPHSHIAYICQIEPARTRNPGDPPLAEDGLGNAEFNTQRDGEWERYDYAYRILSVWKIKQPIGVKMMKEKYDMASDVAWEQQECVWDDTPAVISIAESESAVAAGTSSEESEPAVKKSLKRKQAPQSSEVTQREKIQVSSHATYTIL